MISFYLDKETSFHQTIEPTYIYNNTTFKTMKYSSSTMSYTTIGTTSFSTNAVLIILIKIFGGVDILLNFMYAVIFVIDRQREKSTHQTENTPTYTIRNNSMYENIEI